MPHTMAMSMAQRACCVMVEVVVVVPLLVLLLVLAVAAGSTLSRERVYHLLPLPRSTHPRCWTVKRSSVLTKSSRAGCRPRGRRDGMTSPVVATPPAQLPVSAAA